MRCSYSAWLQRKGIGGYEAYASYDPWRQLDFCEDMKIMPNISAACPSDFSSEVMRTGNIMSYSVVKLMKQKSSYFYY
jgi:hypothetical protein